MFSKRKGISFIVTAALAIGILSPLAQADSFVWQVSKDEHTVLIGGTIHFLHPSDYPLPEEFNQAYEQADNVVFEIDPGVMQSSEAQTTLLQAGTYADGKSIKTELSPAVYQQLQAYSQQQGIPLVMFERFKPGLLMLMLEVVTLQKMGYNAEGVDLHYYNKAQQDEKTVVGLETMAEQAAFIAELGKDDPDALIASALEEFQQLETAMANVKRAWRDGDDAALDIGLMADMKKNFPDVYKVLLVDRNNAWLPQIEYLFVDPDTELVLVGAMHLVGKEGLLSLLEQKGYTVKPFRAESSSQ